MEVIGKNHAAPKRSRLGKKDVRNGMWGTFDFAQHRNFVDGVTDKLAGLPPDASENGSLVDGIVSFHEWREAKALVGITLRRRATMHRQQTEYWPRQSWPTHHWETCKTTSPTKKYPCYYSQVRGQSRLMVPASYLDRLKATMTSTRSMEHQHTMPLT